MGEEICHAIMTTGPSTPSICERQPYITDNIVLRLLERMRAGPLLQMNELPHSIQPPWTIGKYLLLSRALIDEDNGYIS